MSAWLKISKSKRANLAALFLLAPSLALADGLSPSRCTFGTLLGRIFSGSEKNTTPSGTRRAGQPGRLVTDSSARKGYLPVREVLPVRGFYPTPFRPVAAQGTSGKSTGHETSPLNKTAAAEMPKNNLPSPNPILATLGSAAPTLSRGLLPSLLTPTQPVGKSEAEAPNHFKIAIGDPTPGSTNPFDSTHLINPSVTGADTTTPKTDDALAEKDIPDFSPKPTIPFPNEKSESPSSGGATVGSSGRNATQGQEDGSLATKKPSVGRTTVPQNRTASLDSRRTSIPGRVPNPVAVEPVKETSAAVSNGIGFSNGSAPLRVVSGPATTTGQLNNSFFVKPLAKTKSDSKGAGGVNGGASPAKSKKSASNRPKAPLDGAGKKISAKKKKILEEKGGHEYVILVPANEIWKLFKLFGKEGSVGDAVDLRKVVGEWARTNVGRDEIAFEKTRRPTELEFAASARLEAELLKLPGINRYLSSTRGAASRPAAMQPIPKNLSPQRSGRAA